MSLALELTLRILAAGAMGAAIGYERELRGKGAGTRTHLLVALGAALLMIVSQLGFENAIKFDAARIAAAVVGGLGFLGGGIIMKNKHVTGLTTAAGLWVTGALGLSIGCGQYELAVLCFIIIMACMEGMHFYDFHIGEKQVTVILSGRNRDQIISAVSQLGDQPVVNSIIKTGDIFKVEASIMVKKKDFPHIVLERADAIPGITLEVLE